jgi:hypothetical protein
MSNKNTNVYLDAKTSFLEPSIQQYGSHMVMSNVKKSTRQKYINIDTRFTDDYGYNKTAFNQTTSFTFTFPEKIKDAKTIRVSCVELPISFYNFSASLGNNSFKITDISGNSQMVVIKDGNYLTPGELNAEISTEIHALGGLNTDIKYDISANSYSYLDASASSFQIAFDTDSSGNFDKYNFRSKLGWSMGYRSPTYTLPTGGGTPLKGESFVNLNTVRYVYLVVDEYSSGFTNSFVCPLQHSLINKKILARIAIDNHIFPFGTIQISDIFNGLLVTDVRHYNGTVDIQKITVQLVNEYGHSIDLNGMDFSFLLEVTYE